MNIVRSYGLINSITPGTKSLMVKGRGSGKLKAKSEMKLNKAE